MSVSSINGDSGYVDSTSSSSGAEGSSDSSNESGLVSNGEQNVTISSVESSDDNDAETGDDGDGVETDEELAESLYDSQSAITSASTASAAMQSLSQLTSSQSLWNEMKQQGLSERADSGSAVGMDAAGASQLEWTSIDPTSEWINNQNESMSGPHVDANSLLQNMGKVSGQDMLLANGGLNV